MLNTERLSTNLHCSFVVEMNILFEPCIFTNLTTDKKTKGMIETIANCMRDMRYIQKIH